MADEQNPMPEEARTWVRHPVPPESIAEIRANFNEVEFLAEIREVQAGGGLSSEEFLAEIDRVVEEVNARTREPSPAADV